MYYSLCDDRVLQADRSRQYSLFLRTIDTGGKKRLDTGDAPYILHSETGAPKHVTTVFQPHTSRTVTVCFL